MPPPPAPPADARRAAARARDAVRAARARSGAGHVAVDLAEPEAALPVAALARTLGEAASRASCRLVPGGGWAGAPFPAESPYVAVWELELLAERRAAREALTAPAQGRAPVVVRCGEPTAAAEALSPWLVHSFAGRKRHARPEVAALVPASARAVLDVGCGEGWLGASLEARGARVTGIELDPAAAEEAARRLSRVLPLPAEEAVGALDVRPDAVILADVLEHLEAPEDVLRALRPALAPGGRLVFSLPNATHAAVLGGALRGRWDRELEGIVADDHRTYAGRAGWTALLAACGFRVTSIEPVRVPTPLAGADRAALLSATRLEPDDVDAVQWIGTAEVSTAAAPERRGGRPAEDGPLVGEDPVEGVRALAAPGPVTLRAPNPLRAAGIETLLSGGLLSGAEAGGLLLGTTAEGLARRFEGSGLDVRVAPSGSDPLPALVRAALAARRAAGLPSDEEALGATAWDATFRTSGA